VQRTVQWWQRWLGFIFLTVFAGFWRQMPGLIGPAGIAPATEYLRVLRTNFGLWHRLWLAPSLFWFGSGGAAIHVVAAVGVVASLLLMGRVFPRASLGACMVCFLSFIATAQVFASYQSDGMLMSAAFVGLFLDDRAPGRAAVWATRWLWFTIYFGSGVAKLASGDPEWRHLTALDHYYENGPLPTWIGWYAQQYTPHWVNAVTVVAVLVLELGVAWICFGPRRARIACFWIATLFQIAIIATSNYGFLNWLVLGLGLALIDDRHIAWLLRRPAVASAAPLQPWLARPAALAILGAWFLLTAANLAQRVMPRFPAPSAVSNAVAQFRIADPFGLFAVMTRERYELEFQGSADGEHWVAYPFRFKPQEPERAPGIYGPYQPRFDWNLWFASLDNYQNNPWIEEAEVRLLANDPAVLHLFAGNPFAGAAPRAVRVVLWQYWFATPEQKRTEGVWWTRHELGLYAPELAR